MSRVAPAAALTVVAMTALFATLAAQSSDTEAMALGNRLYEDGSYSDAVDVYEELVARGVRSGTLYYNLGNAYFKLGEMGRTILSYRRALGVEPGSGDTVNNLTLAREATVDRFPAPEAGLVSSLSLPARRLLTRDQTAVGALVLWVLLVLSVLAGPFVRDERVRARVRYGAFAAGGLTVLAVAVLAGHVFGDDMGRDTVVVQSEVDLRSGPGRQYVSEVTLHGGAEVTTIESRGAWTRLELPVGEVQGWVPEGAVERVAAD